MTMDERLDQAEKRLEAVTAAGEIGEVISEILGAIRLLILALDEEQKQRTANSNRNGEFDSERQTGIGLECGFHQHEECVMTECTCGCHED